MNCEKCETQLLDLLYGELGDEEAARVRGHVQGCASCQSSYGRLGTARKLAVHMRREEPRAELDREILARASVRAAELAKAKAKTASHGAGEGIWRSVVRFLGGFAMGPQVAMATLLLLMVTIGVYYLPRLRQAPELASGAVVNPDPAGEAAPTGAIEPAPSLELDIDPRTGRIRARNGEPLTRRAEQRHEPVAALTPTPGATPMPQGDHDEPASGTDRAGAVVADLLEDAPPGEVALREGQRFGVARDNEGVADPVGQPAEQQQQQPRQQLAYAGEAERRAPARARTPSTSTAPGQGAAGGLLADGVNTESFGRTDDARLAAGAGGGASFRSSTGPTGTSSVGSASAAVAETERPMYAQAPQEPAAQQPSAPIQASPPPPPVVARTQVAQRNAPVANAGGSAMPTTPAPGPSGGAQSAPPADVVGRGVEGRDLTPGALHAQARNFRSSGALAQAAARYESLLSRYPTYAAAGDALMELADCYRRLGRLGQARNVLERASRSRSTQVAQRARFEIMRIDQAERAPARPAAAAADEAVSGTSR